MMTQGKSCLLNNEASRTDVSLGGNIQLLCLQNPGTEKMLSNRYMMIARYGCWKRGPALGMLDSTAVLAGRKYFPMGKILHLVLRVAL